ncbi:MAG: toxin-antitoxin system YwqK family antitoxin [Spirosomataceae bacterium]
MEKGIYLVIIALMFVSCNDIFLSEKRGVEIPFRFENKSSKAIFQKNDLVYLNQNAYSGFLFELHPNAEDTLAVEGYLFGRLHGISQKWYPNGQLAEQRYYHHGEKQGKQIAFYENGQKMFSYTAEKDMYVGKMYEWASDGQLIHLATYVNGQESGTQKMWYDNGKIKANYTIINGRRYGLLGTKNCKNVSDSIFTSL